MDDKTTTLKKSDEKTIIDPEKAAVAGIGFEDQVAEEAPPPIVVEN